MSKKYQFKYKHLNKDAIKEVREVILKYRIFKLNRTERFILLKELNKSLSKIYKIKKPHLVYDSSREHDGFYNHNSNIIVLNDKLSLITYLHEFKHALQTLKHKKNSENIARSYSLSLFYNASPRHFRRAIRKGLILHQKEL